MNPLVLVPMDGSPDATAGLAHALDRHPEAEITVLHVMAPYEHWDADDPPLPPDVAEEWHEAARARAETIFEEARELADERGHGISTALEVGEAWRAIVGYAEEHDVDHIVVGSHGRSGESALHLGSVAETVSRRSPVTVTIVR